MDKDQDAVDVIGKIIMPMIRKVTPGLIAHQILSVQPMTLPLSPRNPELRLGTAYLGGSKQGDWFTVFVVPPMNFVFKANTTDFIVDYTAWCKETFGEVSNDTWFERDGRFYFRKESDLTMFVLGWAK